MSTNEYMRDYMRASRARRRARLVEMLGGKCIECPATESLEFDHIDPRTKDFGISGNEQYGWEKLVAEARKCVLRCEEHHWRKTRNNGDNPAQKLAPEQVLAIRADSRSQRVVARAFGVSQTHVRDIRLRKRWKDI